MPAICSSFSATDPRPNPGSRHLGQHLTVVVTVTVKDGDGISSGGSDTGIATATINFDNEPAANVLRDDPTVWRDVLTGTPGEQDIFVFDLSSVTVDGQITVADVVGFEPVWIRLPL
ncbi:hypothetical protein [Mesorhizobium sp.]|uniref:hypothetical protein n=1 Tax=Mesorhizobium sp. TaxID=1871066 RepID=UPI00257AEEFA|nr:hypothetical protein [Mesorhizobium sp.]